MYIYIYIYIYFLHSFLATLLSLIGTAAFLQRGGTLPTPPNDSPD